MMRIISSFVILAALVCCSVSRADPLERITKAMQQDDFVVLQTAHAPNGGFGVRGASKSARVLSTGEPKPLYYVSGSHFDMGYLYGFLAPNETLAMCTTYIDHVPVEIVDPTFDEKHADDPLYEEILHLLGEFLTEESVSVFWSQVSDGVIPMELVDEMRGIVAGVIAAIPSYVAEVTLERIITLNFGFDWLSALVFSGELGPHLYSFATRSHRFESNIEILEKLHHVLIGTPNRDQVVLDDNSHTQSPSLEPEIGLRIRFRAPAHCDAFGVSGKATASGSGSIMARDFQLPTGTVFQNIQCMVVYEPGDKNLASLVAASAPGFVGSLTAMNEHGVVMGVDTLRSADSNAKNPGLNSLLLIRHAVHRAKTTVELVDIVADAGRGCSWLYPACDATGDCVSVESGIHRTDSFDPLMYVEKWHALRVLLPSDAFIAEHSSESSYRKGMYVRRANYSYPLEYLSFNSDLFRLADVPYDPSVWGVGEKVFANFTDENKLAGKILNNYFPPQRETMDDVVITSNFAIVPEMRLTQMSIFSNLAELTGSAIQWRYDTLCELIQTNYGSIDLNKAMDLISFLSPDRTPGYWHDYWNPSDPMSAVVEGSMSVCDLQSRIMTTKGGYWKDEWTRVTLLPYLDRQ